MDAPLRAKDPPEPGADSGKISEFSAVLCPGVGFPKGLGVSGFWSPWSHLANPSGLPSNAVMVASIGSSPAPDRRAHRSLATARPRAEQHQPRPLAGVQTGLHTTAKPLNPKTLGL